MKGALIQVTGLVTVYMINSSDATVDDVRKWLDKVESLGMSGDTRLEAANLRVSLRAEHVEKITCDSHGDGPRHVGIEMWSETCKEFDGKNSKDLPPK